MGVVRVEDVVGGWLVEFRLNSRAELLLLATNKSFTKTYVRNQVYLGRLRERALVLTLGMSVLLSLRCHHYRAV